MGPTVTRPVKDPLAVLNLDNRLYIIHLCAQTKMPKMYGIFVWFVSLDIGSATKNWWLGKMKSEKKAFLIAAGLQSNKTSNATLTAAHAVLQVK